MTSANPRRELAAAVAVCAAGAVLVLLAAGQPWVRAVVDLPAPLPSARYALSGRELAGQAAGLGLAGLAGLAGLVATRGAVRAAVGVLLALMGVGAVVFTVTGVGHDHVLGELAARTSFGNNPGVTLRSTPWWAVSVGGGVLLVAAGMFALVRGRRWPGMSGRYDRLDSVDRANRVRATGRSSDEPTAMWDSLDRGADPTAEPAAEPPADRGAERGAERDDVTGKGS